jgi:HK97 family phage major capsid protein
MRLTEERRAELVSRGGQLYRGALKEGRKLTDAETAELRTIEAQIDADDYEKQFGTPTPSEAQRRFTESVEVRSTQRGQVLKPEQRMVDFVRGTYPAEHEGLSLGRFVRGFITGNWDNADLERRAMAEGTVGAGGALVPTPLSARVIDNLRNQATVLRAGAMAIPMASSTLKLARLKTDPTAAWTAENAEITATDGEFEQVTFNAFKLAGLVKASVELIEDAANADAAIENALAEVLALEMDRAALFGAGTTEPKGIHAYANTIVPEHSMGNNGGQITNFDPFSTAYFKCVTNNVMPSAVIYAPRTAETIDKLKTGSTLEPLPPPPSFAGLAKFITNQVPVNLTQGTANNASSAFVGDFAGLGIGIRTQLVLEASRTAGDAFKMGQVHIRAYLRGDIQLLRPKAFTVIRGILP